MQFLKQIKSKALTISIFDKKPSKQQEKAFEQLEICKGTEKQTTIKTMAKSFFSKFKQENKNDQPTKIKQIVQQTNTAPTVNQQGRIWMTAPPPNNPPINSQKNSQQKETNNGQQQIITQDSAEQFIQNMYKSAFESQKADKMRINKAKNSIFGNLQIEPIYLTQNSTCKIFTMELETSHDLLIQRTQSLVVERITVDKSIESVLNSGYLWEAHGLENRNLMQVCFEIIQASSDRLEIQLQEVHAIRQKFQLFIAYLKRISILNRRRVVLAKKIQLLNKIKSYKKDACVQFENLDQAFYLERNRQKLYHQLKVNQKLLQKVVLLQSLVQRIKLQNIKVVDLVENQLVRWVDEGQKLQLKHIQKLLILWYFIRNQKMYAEQNLNVNVGKLKNKNTLIQYINQVKQWKDYKYVNDGAVKAKVSEFLDFLIGWLQKEQDRKDQKDKLRKKISLTSVSKGEDGQIPERVIKF